MIVTFIRALVIFTTLIIVMRLLGKRQIGEMQPYEFIVTLIIADLACVPMADVSIPLIYGVVGILALFLFHQILSLIEQGGNFCKKLISGKPSIVINPNGVDIKELKKNNMGVEDLIESMRAQGYFSLDDLDYAIFESNGKLSAFPKSDYENIKKGLPLLIISEGKLNKKNALMINKENNIEEFLKSNGALLKNTEVMTVDNFGRVYLKIRNKKYKIANFIDKESAQ